MKLIHDIIQLQLEFPFPKIDRLPVEAVNVK